MSIIGTGNIVGAVGHTAALTAADFYTPAMMEFDGSTGYYSQTADFNTVNGWTVTGRIRWDGGTILSAGGFNRNIMLVQGTAYTKLGLSIVNDEVGDERSGTLSISSQSTTGSALATCYSNQIVSDGNVHTFFISYDPATAALVFKIDGADALNTGATGHTLTTGTITTGSNANYIGALTGSSRFFDGNMGFLGLRGAVLTNWSDFMQADGSPKALDESTWTEWGAQPVLWNEHCDMVNNLGSAGAMTKNGTINVGKGGN